MLDAHILDQVLALTVSQGLSEDTLRVLRTSWPGIHFSYCMDDDVCGVEPVRSASGVNVYLVDGRAHCLRLTNELGTATGVVLAEVEDESA